VKPTGSISKYFPFLSVNTLSKIETILQSSSNYDNFVENLCIEAVKKDSLHDLVAFACIGAESLNYNAHLQKILTVHPQVVLGQIFKMQRDLVFGERTDWESLFLLASDLIALNLDPWIEFSILGLLWNVYLSRSVGSLEEEQIEERMWHLINEDTNLKPFSASVHQLRAYRYRAEGSEKEAIEEFKRALAIAEEFDDQMLAAKLHDSIAWGLRNLDMKSAIYHAEQAEKLNPKSFGTKVYMHTVRGEYDISIELYLESIDKMDGKHTNPHYGSVAINLSRIYLEINRPEDALEWAQMSLEKGFFPGPDPAVHSNHFRVSNALAMLGKVEDAEQHLDFAKGEMRRAGSDLHVAEVHFSTGLIELAKEKFKDALWSFTQALEIYEKQLRQTRINSCLRRLAEIEVALYELDDSDPPTQWLTRLEETSRNCEFPGYLGFALLSKVNLRLKQNRLSEAKEILEELIEISRKEGTRFLQPLIAKSLEPLRAE